MPGDYATYVYIPGTMLWHLPTRLRKICKEACLRLI